MIRHLLVILLFASTAYASFDYDGTDDSHHAENPNAPSTTDYTVCAFIYPDNITNGDALISYGNGNDSSAGRGFELAIGNASGNIRLDHTGGTGGTFSAGALTAGTWHQFCVRAQTGTFEHDLFFGAVSSRTAFLSLDRPTAQNSTDDFQIGQTAPDHTIFGRTFFDGRFAHVAYWDTSLSDAEIASYLDKSTCPTDIQSANLKVFLPGTADPMTEEAQSLTVTTISAPVFTANDPTGLPCAAASAKIGSKFGRAGAQFNRGFN